MIIIITYAWRCTWKRGEISSSSSSSGESQSRAGGERSIGRRLYLGIPKRRAASPPTTNQPYVSGSRTHMAPRCYRVVAAWPRCARVQSRAEGRKCEPTSILNLSVPRFALRRQTTCSPPGAPSPPALVTSTISVWAQSAMHEGWATSFREKKHSARRDEGQGA